MKAKERRKLHSESTKHVLPILLECSGALEIPAMETVFHFKVFLFPGSVEAQNNLADSQLSLTLSSHPSLIKQNLI